MANSCSPPSLFTTLSFHHPSVGSLIRYIFLLVNILQSIFLRALVLGLWEVDGDKCYGEKFGEKCLLQRPLGMPRPPAPLILAI
jgi:hypothetical protein